MECRVIKILILLTFMVSESAQDDASVECQSTRLFFSSDRYYSNTPKFKCTFVNVNSVEEMKSVITANSNKYSPSNIISIAFNQSNISEFPDSMFSNYLNLRTLDGSNLRLSSISSSAFGNLVAMDAINLSFNQIKSLSTKVFANRKLKNLDLSNNLIESIDESAFSGSEIEKINLSFNQIKDLIFVNGLKYFNLLQMNDNEIENFEVNLELKLTVTGWSTPIDSFLPAQSPTVNLESNKLKSFECKTPFKFALIELKNNPDLNALNLEQCVINHLDVSDCGNLKKIKLSNSINGFTAKNVKFDQIDFSQSRGLESLKLLNNSMTADTLNDIIKLENLTALDISFNLIGPLNISTFAKLKNLSSLGLKSTNISNIQFGTFSHQSSVRMLDISGNNLGSFDMQMIFSMSSLTYLDISGNDLIELSNIEAAHNTFALLEKIDLTNNKWTCSYLLRLIKIMRAYRVALVQSVVEEHKSNINGIYCRHIAGDDNIIEPLSVDSSNITDVRDKMNEIVSQLTKESQYRQDFEVRLSTLEKRVHNQMMTSNENIQSAKLHEKSAEMQSIVVRNSTFFELTLTVVFCCFIVFTSLKMVVFVKKNFLSRPRAMRVGLSENTLTINEDDY